MSNNRPKVEKHGYHEVKKKDRPVSSQSRSAPEYLGRENSQILNMKATIPFHIPIR